MAEQQSVVSDSLPLVETPEELRDFLDGGAIYDLDYRLKLVQGEPEIPFTIRENDREFSVRWLRQTRKRLLVVQSSLSRLPGLFLKMPIELDECKVAPGEITASFAPMVENRRVPEPYSEGLAIVGKPQAVVKIIIAAGRELSIASGIVLPEDI